MRFAITCRFITPKEGDKDVLDKTWYDETKVKKYNGGVRRVNPALSAATNGRLGEAHGEGNARGASTRDVANVDAASQAVVDELLQEPLDD